MKQVKEIIVEAKKQERKRIINLCNKFKCKIPEKPEKVGVTDLEELNNLISYASRTNYNKALDDLIKEL